MDLYLELDKSGETPPIVVKFRDSGGNIIYRYKSEESSKKISKIVRKIRSYDHSNAMVEMPLSINFHCCNYCVKYDI